jgi:hypothetical protein
LWFDLLFFQRSTVQQTQRQMQRIKKRPHP